MHIINPINEEVIENVLKLSLNSVLDFNIDNSIFGAVGEMGKGAFYKTKFAEVITSP